MGLTRRVFLKSSGIAIVGLGAALTGIPRFLVRAADATVSRRKTLVVVFQRGAADGLNMVVPFAERRYYDLRPTIAVPAPRRGGMNRTIDLDGFFGLHPSLEPFKKLFDAKRLAVVHAAGSPDATRSHFDAQDFMESGTPGRKNTPDGWLNRHLQSTPRQARDTFRAIAVATQLPRVLSGPAPALAIPELSGFDIRGRWSTHARRGLERLYAAAEDPLLSPAATETFEAIDVLRRLDPSRYRPADGADYPEAPLGRDLRQIAQLIKADVGLEIAFAETGGWDHHINEGGAEGALARRLGPFARGIAALVRDLGDRMSDVVIVTLSEFGRSARENGSRGTDHGHANAMFVIGGPVRGGKVYGEWPGLEDEQLHDGRDLRLTTDFRDVVGTILRRHLDAGDLKTVFPGHELESRSVRGLI